MRLKPGPWVPRRLLVGLMSLEAVLGVFSLARGPWCLPRTLKPLVFVSASTKEFTGEVQTKTLIKTAVVLEPMKLHGGGGGAAIS